MLVDDEQIDNLRQAYETVKGAPVDMRAELRSAKLLMVDRNFEGEFTRLLALALSIASELQLAQEESVVRQALRELLIAFPYIALTAQQKGYRRPIFACYTVLWNG